ncbi:MAG: hypothetical protein ACI37Z_09880 [Candidatus Gastranaerophilaceae bacterium]
MKKLDKICAILIVIGLGIVIFNGAFLDNNKIVGFIGLTIFLCSIFINICTRDKKKKSDGKNPVEESSKKNVILSEMSKESNEEIQKNKADIASNNIGNKFDSLMTGQLVAFYKTTHNKDYSDEYERRLQHIGFSVPESKSLFMLELMMLKHDHIPILTDENYLNKNYFNLKTPILPLENSYYVEHQTFLVSEITKIWDEAEWVWTYKKNEEMPNDVVKEIFKLTRYGGGELLVETLKSISEHSHVDIAKIQKYSVSEQDMMFKYKWNKNANEKNPYI